MVATRYEHNPIITTEQVPFRVNSIFNPGAVKFHDSYILICRAELPSGRSCFVLARSKDGIQFTLDKNPWMTSADHGEFRNYVEWGIEDVRVNKIEDTYYLTYTGYSKYMPLVMLASTRDFESFEILGPITEPSNKDCSLFPEKINGLYWRLDRPTAEKRNDIWLSNSKDLIHWGGYRFLAEPEAGTWEADKIGNSTPPIRTDAGWLMLYHGVRGFGITTLYKLGAMLLDLNEPWKVIGKTEYPLLLPEKEYERVGDVTNVVFCNGWILEPNGEVKMYYSGADTNICLATMDIKDIISACNPVK